MSLQPQVLETPDREFRPVEAAPMDDLVLDILHAAVNLARFEQIRRLDTLRARLARIYPGEEDRIQCALKTWAQYHVGVRDREQASNPS